MHSKNTRIKQEVVAVHLALLEMAAEGLAHHRRRTAFFERNAQRRIKRVARVIDRLRKLT